MQLCPQEFPSSYVHGSRSAVFAGDPGQHNHINKTEQTLLQLYKTSESILHILQIVWKYLCLTCIIFCLSKLSSQQARAVFLIPQFTVELDVVPGYARRPVVTRYRMCNHIRLRQQHIWLNTRYLLKVFQTSLWLTWAVMLKCYFSISQDFLQSSSDILMTQPQSFHKEPYRL